MTIPFAGFEWDAGNRLKCEAHGVSVAEIESIFREAIAVLPDPAHSQDETRHRAIGVAASGRHVFVVFTLRDGGGSTLIRPISARYMHRREVLHYEKALAGPG